MKVLLSCESGWVNAEVEKTLLCNDVQIEGQTPVVCLLTGLLSSSSKEIPQFHVIAPASVIEITPKLSQPSPFDQTYRANRHRLTSIMAEATGKVGVSSLAKSAEKATLDDIKRSLNVDTRLSIFACGGSIPINGNVPDGSDIQLDNPIKIRFDVQGRGITVTLPFDGSAAESFPPA